MSRSINEKRGDNFNEIIQTTETSDLDSDINDSDSQDEVLEIVNDSTESGDCAVEIDSSNISDPESIEEPLIVKTRSGRSAGSWRCSEYLGKLLNKLFVFLLLNVFMKILWQSFFACWMMQIKHLLHYRHII